MLRHPSQEHSVRVSILSASPTPVETHTNIFRASLAAVNFFLAIVGITQLTRIALYESSKSKDAAEIVADVKKDVKEHAAEVKDIVKS